MQIQAQQLNEESYVTLELNKLLPAFLERRGFEYIDDIQTMKSDPKHDFDFIHISHIAYDREKNLDHISLLDFEQFLHAAAHRNSQSGGGKFAYLIESDIKGIKLYLGMSKTNTNNENGGGGGKTSDQDFLTQLFQGIYPGSTCNPCLSQSPFTYPLKYSQAMLGIPSLKRDSDKSYKQSLEKIIFPLRNQKFRILLVAESYHPSTIQHILQQSLQLMSEIKHVHIKQSMNATQSHMQNLTETKTDDHTQTKTDTDTKTKTDDHITTKTKASTDETVKNIGIGTTALKAITNETIKNSDSITQQAIKMGIPMLGNILKGAATATMGPMGGFIAGIAVSAATSYTNNLLGKNTRDTHRPTNATGTINITGTFNTTNSTADINTHSLSHTNTHSSSQTDTHSLSSTSTDSISNSTQTTKDQGIIIEQNDKHAQYCEELLEKYIERFQKGLNSGLWNTSLYIQADNKATLSQVSHVLKSVYSGDESFYEPIRFTPIFESSNAFFDTTTLPMLYRQDYTHPLHPSFSGFSSAINTEELAILSALPHHDIEGIKVSRHAHFALTQSHIEKDFIEIGHVLQRGEKTHQRFHISIDELNHHAFISGITGSGKSNTIKNILLSLQDIHSNHSHLSQKIPFLLIEPAKSEYKHLKTSIKDLQIFRPGNAEDIFRLNPFVFERQEELTKHVDMLKVTFSAAFPMEGPMPYILENALHQIYEDKGWDFESESNPFFLKSKDANQDKQSLLFPTMQDLRNKIDSVVTQSGYAGELDSNLKAALKTRIQNLTLGTKGKIYNTRHALDESILFEKPTIIELSSIADDCEKAFLMGLLLQKLYRYQESKGDASNTLRHICIIEEAHRLLPNIALDKSNSESNQKGSAIQTFVNILAEIRSLGEGIIIADQIASKLHPDVLKNTSLKIIHRTMDKEDREKVGNAINLTENQILDIAQLAKGQAIVHNKEVHEAFMVSIDKYEGNLIDEADMKDFYHDFLQKNPLYQYNYIAEERFYLENHKEVLTYIHSLSLSKRKKALLDILDAILLDQDIQVISQKLKNFTDLYDKDSCNHKAYGYLFAATFASLPFISNMQYYRTIDAFLNVYHALLDLCLETNEQEIHEIIHDVKKYFAHRYIKKTFPSMKCPKNNIDYTLLLLEHMQMDEKLKADLAKEAKDQIKHYEQTLKEYFHLHALREGLLHSLMAIRSGNHEINIPYL